MTQKSTRHSECFIAVVNWMQRGFDFSHWWEVYCFKDAAGVRRTAQCEAVITSNSRSLFLVILGKGNRRTVCSLFLYWCQWVGGVRSNAEGTLKMSKELAELLMLQRLAAPAEFLRRFLLRNWRKSMRIPLELFFGHFFSRYLGCTHICSVAFLSIF